MKGLTKAIMRTPHLVSSKVGMAKKTDDPEFDELNRKVTTLEAAIEKLIKDTKTFSEGVTTLFTGAEGWATHFNNIFNPIAGEYNTIGKHPEAADTIRNVTEYSSAMQELRTAVVPELELIQTRIIAPCKEFQSILKVVRKNITKREHKLTDYDRFNNSLTKLREKKDKSLSDEKNLFKLEQDFEQATADYELYNGNLKTELPRFMVLASQLIDPLFHSFFYVQLNVFYIMLEKLRAFSDGKYTQLGTASEVAEAYEAGRSDARDIIDNLSINKRLQSTAKILATRQTAGASGSTLGVGGAPGLGRSTSSTSTTTSTRLPSGGSSTPLKKAPPPPPPAAAAAPPPYTPETTDPSAFGAVAATPGTKRPPPPIPALKPKPKPAPVYVVALYDFDAQADGDLSFKTGNRIEIVERTPSVEDWWTGKLNGQQGIFPGNYVQDT